MAIWQFRLMLIPENELLTKFDVLPPLITMEFAEGSAWWSSVQPPKGFETQIDLILPRMASWSSSMLMWGQKHCDDAHVCYRDERKDTVQEIAFRIDARSISTELVRRVCTLARQLGCVLMTADYEILLPDESMVLTILRHSTARKFVDDPVSTLQSLDHKKIEEQFDYLAKRGKRDFPLKE